MLGNGKEIMMAKLHLVAQVSPVAYLPVGLYLFSQAYRLVKKPAIGAGVVPTIKPSREVK